MKYKIKVEVIRHKETPVPDWGLGEGILATQVIEVVKVFQSPITEIILDRAGQELLKETVKITYEKI